MSDLISAKPLIVAISSRALFDLEDSHRIFEREGLAAYRDYQLENEDTLLNPGVAFPLVKKLLSLNSSKGSMQRVEVILLSRNSGDTGLRVFNSIESYGLDISRAAFTNGLSPYRYIPAFGAQLFLSANGEDVKNALNEGYAAATIFGKSNVSADSNEQLKIAFDGDAVLFSDEAEQVFQKEGLEAFSESESASATTPLSGGPFKEVLAALHYLQSQYTVESCPIRTALVTARSAPTHKRVILTLRKWGIRIDEVLFLGGREKTPFLQSFGADIFFDDQRYNCEAVSEHIPAGHVPHGIKNNE